MLLKYVLQLWLNCAVAAVVFVQYYKNIEVINTIAAGIVQVQFALVQVVSVYALFLGNPYE